MMQLSSSQEGFFCNTLRELVTTGTLSDDHPLKHCPLDPFTSGSSSAEKRAVATLNKLAGPHFSLLMRRLWYGYVCSGRRISALRQGAIYLALYDDELRALLADVFELPNLQLWDEQKTARFYETIRRIDAERMAS